MNIRLISVALLLIINLAASAQKRKMQTVMLDDGTQVTGTIVTGLSDKTGYSIRLSASQLAGRNSDGKTGTISIHLSNGYQFKNGLSAGFGTGIEKLNVSIMPVYADLRFQPFKSRVSPFIWIKSGFSFPLNDHISSDYYYYDYYSKPKGGIMFSTGAGIALYSWKRNAVNIGLGYRYQELTFTQSNVWGGDYIQELVTRFNRIEVQFGFIFR